MTKTTKRRRAKQADKPGSLQGQERDRALLRRQVRISKDVARLGRQLIASLKRQDVSLVDLTRHLADELGYSLIERLQRAAPEK